MLSNITLLPQTLECPIGKQVMVQADGGQISLWLMGSYLYSGPSYLPRTESCISWAAQISLEWMHV